MTQMTAWPGPGVTVPSRQPNHQYKQQTSTLLNTSKTLRHAASNPRAFVDDRLAALSSYVLRNSMFSYVFLVSFLVSFASFTRAEDAIGPPLPPKRA